MIEILLLGCAATAGYMHLENKVDNRYNEYKQTMQVVYQNQADINQLGNYVAQQPWKDKFGSKAPSVNDEWKKRCVPIGSGRIIGAE